MASTIEKAKADDPRELRKRIAQLEAEAKKVPAPERVEVHAFTDDEIASVASAREAIEDLTDTLKRVLDRVGAATTTPARPSPAVHHLRPEELIALRKPAPSSARSDSRLGAGERAILTAVAQHRSRVTREQLTVLTGYKRSSRDTYLQRLRAAGLVSQVGDELEATHAGVAELGDDFEPLPTGQALVNHWLGKLPEGERRIFEIVVRAHPRGVARDSLSERTGYKRSSRDTYLQRLGARKLVESSGGEVRASGALFS